MMVLLLEEAEAVSPPMQRNILGELAGKGNKYYLATMQVFDEEGKKKVARHQKLRKNKGF